MSRVALDNLPLARTAINADAKAREDPHLLHRLAEESTTRVLLVHRGRVATGEGGLILHRPAELPLTDWSPGRVCYLGREGPLRFVSVTLPDNLGAERDLDGMPTDTSAALVDLVAAQRFSHLRDIGDQLSDRDAGLATSAVALAAWHERNPRCPRCGAATEVLEAGWVRRCLVEGSVHFPRTDAAVIMTVVDSADRLLLGHATHWPARRFSTLAGYVEPGEALEEAVRREVAEETAITVGEVSYRGSQPWPFPCSLMMAFHAHVAAGAGTEIRVDGEEIGAARFITREDLAAEVGAESILLPQRSSIARALIEDWFGGELPRR